MNQQAESILAEVKKAIVGKDNVLARALMVILSRGHILLEDVPGVGKTTLALAFSRAMGIEYRRVQFTPDVVPSDILGFSIYDKQTGNLTYKPGAVMCNLLLADGWCHRWLPNAPPSPPAARTASCWTCG